MRHFGESLAALPWLPPAPTQLVDLGSGAGFPGLVLAAVRPDLEVTLVEARERKWAFLAAACRRASLSCRCLNVRVGPTLAPQLPGKIDVVTLRALRLPRTNFEAMLPALSRDARVLVWGGHQPPELPERFELCREQMLPGSEGRRIREFRRGAQEESGP